MAHNRIALDLAAFVDSDEAKALTTPDPAEVRRVAEAFLSICYDELGKKPNLLDGQDVHVALGHLLPGRLKRMDGVADHVPAILEALFAHLETTGPLSMAFEIRQAIASTTDEFLETVKTGVNHHHVAPREKPFVHGAEKLGRNDPCSCGSGKKFKKCHGKNA